MARIFSIFVLLTVAVGFQNCGQAPTAAKSTASVGTGNTTVGSSGNTVTAPLVPSGLSGSSPSATQINLSWNDNSNNETGFRVERAYAIAGPFTTGMGPFTTIATVGANVKTYNDLNLQPSTLYYYRVSSVNGVVYSAPSATISVTTQTAPVSPPSPPSALTATATAATLITLNWSDNSNNESYFKIERSTNNGTTFTLVATASADVRTWTDINLNPQSTLTYRVRASNSAGDSNFTANASATTPAAGNTATYSYISVNVLGPNCVECHGPALAAAGYNFSTYNATFANRNAMINSITSGRMPPGAPLPTFQINALNSWLNAGAPNN